MNVHVAKGKSREVTHEVAQKYDVTNIKIAVIIFKTSFQPQFL